MATKVGRMERVITLPTKLLEKCNGFSLDFGGSVVKVCYLAKKDWENGQKGEEAPLTLTSYSREELDECLEFLKNHCYVRRTTEGDKPVMCTTGVGTHQFGKRIEEKLEVKLENVLEMNCFCVAMKHFLDSKPLEDFCVPFEQKISDLVKNEVDKTAKGMKAMRDAGMADWLIDADATTKNYSRTPSGEKYVIAVFGSGWGAGTCYEKLNDYFLCNVTSLGGRSFLGLGRLLTGAKSYDELLELAEKGNNLNIDVPTHELAAKTEESKEGSADDVYGGWEEAATNRPIFLWGKATDKDLSDFKKEDIARTLLYSMTHHLAITAYDSLKYANARHVFMAGSFCKHPLVQKMVIDQFEHRKWQLASWVPNLDADYHLHFLQDGSHFGAIGAMIMGAEKSSKKDK